MRKLMIISTLVLAACASGGSNDDGDAVSDRVGDWNTTLSPTNNSSVRGTAKAQSVGVGFGANISISGAAAGAQHPWHVHTGTCATGGPVVGNAADYPVLVSNASGTASANATINVALNEQQNYHVNVHRTPSDLTVISCGNLDN